MGEFYYYFCGNYDRYVSVICVYGEIDCCIVIPQVRSLGEAMIWVLEFGYNSFSSSCQRVLIPSRYYIIGTPSLVWRRWWLLF